MQPLTVFILKGNFLKIIKEQCTLIQNDGRGRRERHRSSDMEFPDIGDLVTLDTIGYEDENTVCFY